MQISTGPPWSKVEMSVGGWGIQQLGVSSGDNGQISSKHWDATNSNGKDWKSKPPWVVGPNKKGPKTKQFPLISCPWQSLKLRLFGLFQIFSRPGEGWGSNCWQNPPAPPPASGRSFHPLRPLFWMQGTHPGPLKPSSPWRSTLR